MRNFNSQVKNNSVERVRATLNFRKFDAIETVEEDQQKWQKCSFKRVKTELEFDAIESIK